MSEEFEIRAAVVDDIEALRSLEAAADRRFAEVGMQAVADSEPTDAVVLRGMIASRHVWVVDDGRRSAPLGFAVVADVDGALHIDQISVDPEHEHREIGRRLLDWLVERAREASQHAVTMTTFRDVPWNAPYYERLGFREIPEGEITEGLSQIREREAAAGLDAWPRVSMRLSLGER